MKKLYLYTNDHFSAKSVANAVMIKKQLGEPIEGDTAMSSSLVTPSFQGIVNRRPTIADLRLKEE